MSLTAFTYCNCLPSDIRQDKRARYNEIGRMIAPAVRKHARRPVGTHFLHWKEFPV